MLFVGALPFVSACGAEMPAGDGDEPISETTEAMSAPSGLGTYCSKTSSNGAWTLGILANLTGNSCSGGATTVQRHGFYSISGWNSAYIRCGDNSWWVAHGNGDAPLNNVMNAASGRSGCIITAALLSLLCILPTLLAKLF
jgi:hypothetical protein